MAEIIRYSEAEKIDTIRLLHSSLMINANANITPNFKLIAQLKKIPEDTLRTWWSVRERYKDYLLEFITDSNVTIALKLHELMLKSINTIEERGTDSMTTKELLDFLRQSFAMIRLATGQSTENHAHKITGTINQVSDAHVKVPEDE